jgi:alpha-glucosidase (family GH31 glycosyl hydrolase)
VKFGMVFDYPHRTWLILRGVAGARGVQLSAVALVASLWLAAAPARGAELDVQSGTLTAQVSGNPWLVTWTQRGGAELRSPLGLYVRDASGAVRRAERATELRREGEAVVARVTLDGGGVVDVRVTAAGEGGIAMQVDAPAGAAATGIRFGSPPGERFFGFGERSDAVERSGRETENYVSDGPVRPEDREYVRASVPPWAIRDRDDSTYFPLPWALSDRGYGVLIDEDATSRFRTATDPGAWEAEADGARLRFRVFAGPTPAQALGRFTEAVGRQPPPQAPWTFGPWFQTGQPNVVPVQEEREITRLQREAGAPVSVAETQMHYLPCGAHKGREDAERERTDSFHRDGLARLVYFNPALCASYSDVFARASAAGVLQKSAAGSPFLYPAFVGGSGPAGFTQEPLAQFDFTHPATEAFYAELVREAVDGGADGWMEDFGENTPPQATQHDGSTGDAAHNRYPTTYHCTVQRIAGRFGRPLVRFQRSGWTGSARCAEVVWGGDPTTVWGFDGLSSAVTQMLSMGLSGVSRWGTDIGGYVSFGAGQEAKPGATEDETLTPELLTRWIELGGLVPVMRTKRSGIALPSYQRPQVWDRDQIGVWRRMTTLHAQLNPYLRAADDEHRRSGLPIARHMVLAYPSSAPARSAHDQYLLGPDLLAAPVTEPGVKERKAWLPPGRWVDWWRSTTLDAGAGEHRLAGRARVLSGNREATLPAPLGEPPLLLRAGAVLPLLTGDVDTLSPYGREAGLTRLADRAGVLRLLVTPRGSTLSQLADGASARSIERRRRWVLRMRARRPLSWRIEATLATLRRPFAARRVLVDGRPLSRRRWHYDPRSRVLRVQVRGRRVRLEARG